MPNTIKMKHSTVAGKVPVAGDLEIGEFAVDVEEGKIYYKKASNGQVNVLTQKIYNSNSGSAPANPKDGAFWWKRDVGELWFWEGVTANAWKLAGIPERGGTFKGHIFVRNLADTETVFSTADTGITTKQITATGKIAFTDGDIIRKASSVTGVNGINATFPVAITALVSGLIVEVIPSATNTNRTVTLNVSGLGAKSIIRQDGTNPYVGDIVIGRPALFTYTGSHWILLNPVFATTVRETLTPQVYNNTAALLDTFTFTHSLGVIPSSVLLWLECITPEWGYSAGEKVILPTSPYTAQIGGGSVFFAQPSVRLSTTNIKVDIPRNGIAIVNLAATALQGYTRDITNSYWKIGGVVSP